MKLIQVGFGSFGNYWINYIKNDPDIEWAAIVDVNPEAIAQAPEKTGIDPSLCFTDMREAFGKVQADAVICITPPATHRLVAETAFEFGLHVLTEKPQADSMENARAMVAAAESAGKILMVSQNYRFCQWARTMRRLLKEGIAGKLESGLVRCKGFADFRGDFREKMPYPFIIDMSIHYLDLIRCVTGANPVSAYAESWNPACSLFENDASCFVCYGMDNGMRIIYDGSWAAPQGADLWEFDCEAGQVRLGNNCIEIASNGEVNKIDLDPMPIGGQAYSLKHFRESIETGAEPETSGRDNLGSVAMVFSAVESARIRERVDVKV